LGALGVKRSQDIKLIIQIKTYSICFSFLILFILNGTTFAATRSTAKGRAVLVNFPRGVQLNLWQQVHFCVSMTPKERIRCLLFYLQPPDASPCVKNTRNAFAGGGSPESRWRGLLKQRKEQSKKRTLTKGKQREKDMEGRKK